MLSAPEVTSSKYEAALSRYHNRRMQFLAPTPAARPVSPAPVSSLAPPERDSRRLSCLDAEQLRVLRDVRREEEVEFGIRRRVRGLERQQVQDEEWEWVDGERD